MRLLDPGNGMWTPHRLEILDPSRKWTVDPHWLEMVDPSRKWTVNPTSVGEDN